MKMGRRSFLVLRGSYGEEKIGNVGDVLDPDRELRVKRLAFTSRGRKQDRGRSGIFIDFKRGVSTLLGSKGRSTRANFIIDRIQNKGGKKQEP